MSLAEDFFDLAQAATEALERIRNPIIKSAIDAVKRVCDDAKRSWSGSNIGYHATVYYVGLQPKPPGVEFSPEWGLMDRWPTHQPNPGWTEMDYQTVIDELVARAGGPNIDEIENSLSILRKETSALKETAISLFSVALQDGADAFLNRKLEQVEPITVADRNKIAPTLVPSGGWSRDSLAMSQGKRIAPHQSLMALHLSTKVLENALETIAENAREAGQHLERLERQNRKMNATGKKVFIGHGQSKIWLELQNFLRDRLHLSTDEFNSVPTAGLSNKERLEEALDDAAFAFLIMTPEDDQPDGTIRARQNVVHEAGLFQGRLGFRKAIILLEEPCEEFSNIEGLGQIRFPKNKLSAAFEDIRRVLEREGLVAVS